MVRWVTRLENQDRRRHRSRASIGVVNEGGCNAIAQHTARDGESRFQFRFSGGDDFKRRRQRISRPARQRDAYVIVFLRDAGQVNHRTDSVGSIHASRLRENVVPSLATNSTCAPGKNPAPVRVSPAIRSVL